MQIISRSSDDTEIVRLPGSSRQSSIRRIGTILLFLLPSAIIYLVFVFLPVFQAAYYSFYRWNGLGPLVDFVGPRNYALAFTNQVFLGAFAHNILIAVLSLFIQLPFSLILALIIGKDMPGRAFFRTIFFMPYILSDVIAGLVWS